MLDIYLRIFPQGSLASSVTTTVWVGIFVSAFFNLRFGWTMSGLVVPGYLVPLLIVKPWSATVVIIEGILSYVIVALMFKYMSRFGGWSSVFGRDRFFALLLVSVIVRILLDGWLLPIIGEMINTRFGIHFDYQNQLYSFGLIIVALIANQFWKPGFFQGIPPFVVTVGLTYLIVRYGLMEFTNFSISNLGYMYEDIATSMLASPKAYIILLTTAFIASHMNLRYGWEYSGILIPSLISLLWYQPAKIVASFVETFVILIAASFILRLPVFRKTTIEGTRKILLFFNISYAYKFLLAYAILWFMPEQKITDFYGFGYLLPSLLAIKMYDKEIAIRITRATIQTSLIAIILASTAGFSMTFLPKLWTERLSSDYEADIEILRFPHERLIDIIQKEEITLYQARFSGQLSTPLPGEIEVFSEGIRNLMQYREHHDLEVLTRAQRLLSKVNYRIQEVEQRYLYLYESAPRRDRGIYVIDTQSQKQFVVEIPAPLSERGSLKAGTLLFTMMEGKALAIAGSISQNGREDSSVSGVSSARSFFHAFHKELAYRDVVQVRGYTPQNIPALRNLLQKDADRGESYLGSTLWVKSSLPPGLHLGKLKERIGEFRVEWGKPPGKNLQRDITGSGFAELYLNRRDMIKLFFEPILAQHEVPVQFHEQRIDGYLQDWLLSGKARIAPEGSERYVLPKLEELLFFDEEIMTPLIRISKTEYQSGQWSITGQEELRTISAAAAMLGYNLLQYHHKRSGQDYLILMEQENSSTQRYWGTYVIRLGEAYESIIQIPRPLFELHVFEYGVSLFESLNARALLISGTHKDANLDGSADIVRVKNLENPFNLVHQVILREFRDEPMLVIQTRALGLSEDQPLPEADLLIAFHNGIQRPEGLSPLGQKLLNTLTADGLSIRFVDGSPETAGYEVGNLPQSLYLPETHNKELVILWLSPVTRSHYRQQTDNWQEAQFNTLGIPTVTSYLHTYIGEKTVWETTQNIPELLYDRIRQYSTRHDIVVLQFILDRWPHYQLKRFIDLNTRQSFLLVFSRGPKLLLVANLAPKDFESRYLILDDSSKEETISRFVDTRAAWLSYRIE